MLGAKRRRVAALLAGGMLILLLGGCSGAADNAEEAEARVKEGAEAGAEAGEGKAGVDAEADAGSNGRSNAGADAKAGEVADAGAEGERVSNSVFPASAYEGIVDGLVYALGDVTTGMAEAMVEGAVPSYFAGGLYFVLADAYYFTTARLDASDEVIDGEVTAIGFGAGHRLFGIEVGETFLALAERLGEPDEVRTPTDNVNNEFYEAMWTAHYQLGAYELIFAADAQDGPTVAAYYMEAV